MEHIATNKLKMTKSLFILNKSELVACLQAVWGCSYRGKTPENPEFAIADAILDARVLGE